MMKQDEPEHDQETKRALDRRDALAKMATFGAFTAPLVLGTLTASRAVAATPGSGGGVSGDAGN